MKKSQSFFYKISRLPGLAVLILLFLAIELILFLHIIPGFSEASGGAPIPDMSFAYPVEFIEQFLAGLDAGGFGWYRGSQILDIFLPPVLFLLFAAILYRIYSKKYDDWKSYRWIVYFPVLALVFDYGENICVTLLINMGRDFPRELGQATSVLGTLKYGCVFVTILFILSGLAYFVKGRKDSALSPSERAKRRAVDQPPENDAE